MTKHGCRHMMLIMVASIPTVAMLLLSTPSPAYAEDCTPTCKKYIQWNGGTAGGWQNISINIYGAQCLTGCSWIQKGMWVKNNSTSTYIFVGMEITQTSNRYLYIVSKTSTGGPIYNYIGDVDRNDYQADVTVYRYGFTQRVTLVSYVPGGQRLGFGRQTTADEVLWDLIHTGTRIMSISGAADVDLYNTWYHHWMCWTCAPGGVWYTQTSDGQALSQGNASRMYQGWYIPPHLPDSLGGTYEAWCDAPYCP